MNKQRKKTGGARPGAGRKQEYKEPKRLTIILELENFNFLKQKFPEHGELAREISKLIKEKWIEQKKY